MANYANKKEFRKALLNALGVEKSLTEVDKEEFREGILQGLNASYTTEDLKVKDKFRAKLVTAVAEAMAGGGSSDFSMAEVTLVNSADSNRAVLIPVCYEPSRFNPDASVESTVQMVVNETLILNVPLYKGHCVIRKGISEDRLQGVTVATSFTVTSGSATSSMSGVDITGDCTITIS